MAKITKITPVQMQRTVAARLALFDASTLRQEKRQRRRIMRSGDRSGRGWNRQDLYIRGRAG